METGPHTHTLAFQKEKLLWEIIYRTPSIKFNLETASPVTFAISLGTGGGAGSGGGKIVFTFSSMVLLELCIQLSAAHLSFVVVWIA